MAAVATETTLSSGMGRPLSTARSGYKSQSCEYHVTVIMAMGVSVSVSCEPVFFCIISCMHNIIIIIGSGSPQY